MMERKSYIDLISPIIIFFVLLFVFSKWGPSIPVSILSQQKGEPLIVSGEGKVFVTPDIAKISFGIQENGPSLKAVQDRVDAKSKSLTASFKNLGITENDIKTNSYSVYPQYDWENTGQRITGFQVSINYEVTVRDFDKVNNAITAGTTAGANVVGGINFEVNDKAKKDKMQEARKIAVDDAKEKAEGLANAAGISLGKIINITENIMGEPQPFLFTREAAMGGDLAIESGPDVKPGQTEINVTVSLFYETR